MLTTFSGTVGGQVRQVLLYLVLSAFTSSPISIVAATKASAFSFRVYILPLSILTSSA